MSAGPVAEEAAKLAEALQAWLSAGPGGSLPLAHDSAECRICPLCQAIRALRGLRPEVVEHLAAATTELTAALAAAIGAAAEPAPPPRETRVEKIDLDE